MRRELKLRERAVITEEVPGVVDYRWFVSDINLHKNDERRKLFSYRPSYDGPTQYWCPKFMTLEEAEIWCADHGLLWDIERWEP